jgi:hypothetical protein
LICLAVKGSLLDAYSQTSDPFGRGICCDVDPDEISAIEPDDDEGIEQVETDSWNNEQSMAAISGAWLRKKVRQP